MKKLNLLFVSLISIVTLSSCSLLGELVSFGSESWGNSLDTDSWSPITLGEYAGQKITLAQINDSMEIKCMDSIGEQNLLVIPVCFSDYTLSTLNIDKNTALTNIQNAFFGDSEDTGWEFVKSYYEKSSYGKLTINGMVTDVFTLDKTLSEVLSINASSDYYDHSYYILEKATEWFKQNYSSQVKDFDKNNDGYIDGIWLVYMNDYMDDSSKQYYVRKEGWNLSSSIDYAEYEKATNLLWAYTYWNYDSESNKTNPNPFAYCFGSYDFLWDGGYSKPDTHTFVHETGHLLGLDDYYNYDYNPPYKTDSPCGALDMMDNNIGDHNSYSKYLMNWVTPKIVKEAGNYEIGKFTQTGDCLLVPSSLDNFNDSPFSEYLLIEFYTPDQLNYHDALYKYTNGLKMFTDYGVRIYHIDSRLVKYEYNFFKNEFELKGFTNNYINGSNSYCAIGASNTPSYSVSGENLLTLVSAQHPNDPSYTYEDRSNASATNSDLFKANKSITNFTFNDGSSLDYTITIDSISGDKATISFVQKNI